MSGLDPDDKGFLEDIMIQGQQNICAIQSLTQQCGRKT